MIGQRVHPQFVCAVCADGILGELPHREPFGRDGAMVNVCSDCHAPQPSRNPELLPAYQVPDVADHVPEMQAKIGRIVRGRPRKKIRRNEGCSEKTDGWILVRVPRRAPDGATRDRFDALATIAAEPWIAELRYLGTDPAWFLFERPPTVILGSFLPSENPLAAIEPYRDRVHGARKRSKST